MARAPHAITGYGTTHYDSAFMIFAFRHRHTAVGVLIASLAALYRIALGSSLTNDDFSHLTLSRQLLGGDLPVRDFVERNHADVRLERRRADAVRASAAGGGNR